MVDTSTLIKQLAADGERVKRLRPPHQRAALWLLAAGLVGGTTVLLLGDRAVFLARIGDAGLAVEWAAILVTGIAAVMAAFHLSLPDRSPTWALLPLPSLAVWIASSGYVCYRQWVVAGTAGWALGPSATCFMFILVFSLPFAASLLLMLRRSAPLAPVLVAAVGALGVAAIVAAVLQSFHPMDATFLDLGVHLGTIGLVVAGISALEHLRSFRSPA